MPTPEQILTSNTAIAHDGLMIAFLWHVALMLAFLAALYGWRPKPRTEALLIATLPASVAGFAFAYGNPFNAAAFIALTVGLVAFAVRDRRAAILDVPRWSRTSGAAMLGFGWVYPHFLDGSAFTYLYAAPVGLLPCPTLAVAIGLALYTGGAGRRTWQLLLATAGLFYGVYGVARLGVWLDIGLIAGAGLLAAHAFGAGNPARDQGASTRPGMSATT